MVACKVPNCTGKLRTHKGRSVGTACDTHAPQSKGTGTLICVLCKRPQTEHDLGYWDHATIEDRDNMRRGR